jgi:hypothetical protein
MLTVGKVVHDSLNSLSFQDEIRQVSKYIVGFVKKVNFLFFFYLFFSFFFIIILLSYHYYFFL